MKIFGRGKDTDQAQDADDFDTAVADDAGFDDAGDAGLSATPDGRFGMSGGGASKKKILILFVLLLVGGGFAGMMMMGGSDTPPPLAAIDATMPPATPLDPNALPVDPNAPAMPAPDAAMAGADTGMPPMPEMPPMPTPVADGTQVGAIDPMTGVPMVAQPGAPVDPLAPVTIDPVTGQPVAPAADPMMGDPMADPLTAAVTPVDPNIDPAAVPPADPLAPVAPVAPVAPAMDAIDAEADAGMDNMTEAPAMPGAAVPATTTTTTTSTTTVPVDGAAGPVDGVADATATTTTSTTTTTTAADPAATGEAEGAVVDNADMVDAAEPEMMPVPRTPEDIANLWAQLPVEQAMVRPLPNSYVTVKKEQAAESLDSRLATARRALNDGRTAAALQFFNELRMDYPSDTRVLMGRAVTLQRLGQNAEALEGYEDVLVNDPKNLDALTNMLGLIKQQNPQLALEKLTDLRNLYPYNADITTQLAVAHGQMGNLNESLRFITLAEALRPDSGYVLYNKAVLYDRLGRTTEAADMYRTLVRRAADGELDQTLPIESIKNRLSTIR